MSAVARLLLQPAKPSVGVLAVLTFVAGAAGMVVSFAFLASNHPLDVTAGAAGFVAGAVLVASGLISLSLQRRLPLVADPPSDRTFAVTFDDAYRSVLESARPIMDACDPGVSW